jgi:hypothetical protein
LYANKAGALPAHQINQESIVATATIPPSSVEHGDADQQADEAKQSIIQLIHNNTYHI